jgi:hypothetical protein
MLNRTVKGVVLATAVGALFAAGTARGETKAPPKDKETTKQVRCGGSNDCKGKSSCMSQANSCMGQNSCKGKGWTIEKSAKACADKGGKVLGDAAGM